MNIPKIDIEMPQYIIDMCASDSNRTCETCDLSPEECRVYQEITIWLEVNTD